MSKIKKSYFNPKFSASFSGLSKFFAQRRLGLDKKQVEDELLKLPEYYLYRPARRKIKRRRVMVNLPNFQILFDLIDLQRFSKENNSYKYILIVIDGFSRKMYTVPIKDKKGSTLVQAMKKVFKQMPVLPKYAQSDDGTEFINKEFQTFLKSKDVIWFSTYSNTKASIAERAISTLMTRLTRIFTHNNNNKYLKVLPMVTNSYNSTKHSSLGKYSPNEVNKDNQQVVWLHLYKDLLKNKPIKEKFAVGDKVRISLVKTIFEKGYAPKYSIEVFTITKIRNTDPVVYYLKDSAGEEIKGAFYEKEFLRFVE